MKRFLTTEEFIEKARSIHGDLYDYSLVDYKDTHTKVTIICPIHGEFEQKPLNHLSAKGCKKCARNKKSNKEEFIEKAKVIHGNWYDYSKVEYKNAHEKVTIICPEHGEFKQKPNNHLNGNRCRKCVDFERIYTKEEFTDKAKEVHDDWYDYSKAEYIHNKTKIVISCPIHGDFEQKPNDHLNGHGCPECAAETRRFWNPEYIRKHHPDKLDNACTLYIIECCYDNELFIKIGITTKTIEDRYNNESVLNGYQYTTLYEYQSTLLECSEIEQEVLKHFKDYQYQPMNWFSGSTECLQHRILSEILFKIQQED